MSSDAASRGGRVTFLDVLRLIAALGLVALAVWWSVRVPLGTAPRPASIAVLSVLTVPPAALIARARVRYVLDPGVGLPIAWAIVWGLAGAFMAGTLTLPVSSGMLIA